LRQFGIGPVLDADVAGAVHHGCAQEISWWSVRRRQDSRMILAVLSVA
jgi:hypothetical protein